MTTGSNSVPIQETEAARLKAHVHSMLSQLQAHTRIRMSGSPDADGLLKEQTTAAHTSSPLERAEEYRQQAQGVRTLAQHMGSKSARLYLLGAAKRLEALAEEEERMAERAADLSEQTSET